MLARSAKLFLSHVSLSHVCRSWKVKRRCQKMTCSCSDLWRSSSRDGRWGACFHRICLRRTDNLSSILAFLHLALHGSDLYLICVDTTSSKLSFQRATCFMIRTTCRHVKSKYQCVSYLQILKQSWQWKQSWLIMCLDRGNHLVSWSYRLQFGLLPYSEGISCTPNCGRCENKTL